MHSEDRLRNRLERIERQLFQTNILLLILIAICLLGFTGKLGFVLIVIFWIGLIVGFIYLIMAIIDNIASEKAQQRMEQEFRDVIEKAKAEKQES